jgi:phosphoribosyl-dephospho-CoA transferase
MAVTLEEVLQNREARLERQQNVARRAKTALISFTMCRLFDLDILDRNLNAISRRDVGKEERQCFICDRAAHLCARARTHSLQELQQAVQRYLT